MRGLTSDEMTLIWGGRTSDHSGSHGSSHGSHGSHGGSRGATHGGSRGGTQVASNDGRGNGSNVHGLNGKGSVYSGPTFGGGWSPVRDMQDHLRDSLQRNGMIRG